MTDHGPGSPMAALALLRARLDDLENALQALAGDVTALADQAAARTTRAIWWPDLDRDTATGAWAQLGDWVSEVPLARAGAHERHRTLRACWRAHPDVVDELTALRVIWLDAYANPATTPTSAADYLGKYLPAAMARIEAAFTADGCTAGINSTHKDPVDHRPGRQWTPQETAEFLTADTAARPDPPKD